MKCIASAMKFGNQSKSSLLLIFKIADFDPKLNCTWPEFWYSNIISNKLIGIDKLDPKLQNCEI